MPPKKKDRAAAHAARFANRASERLEKAAKDARGGKYDANRLAVDVANATVDTIDLWSTLLGYGASPQVGVADFGEEPSANWIAGLDITVRIVDQVAENPIFPANPALNQNALKLRPVDGGAAVDLQLTQVDRLDDGFELKVYVRDLSPGPGSVAPGEYFANLFYTTAADPTKVFAALIRGAVV